MLQGHAMTLTFKVATQMLRTTRRLNMVVIYINRFEIPISNNKVMGRTRMARTDELTDIQTDGRTDHSATICSPEIFRGA